MVESRQLGTLWFVSVLAFWIYYTFWIVISPFVEPTHSLQRYFPDRKWGIVVPVLLGLGYLCFALTFVGLALISDSKLHKRMTEARQESLTDQSQPTVVGTPKRDSNHASGNSAPVHLGNSPTQAKNLASYKYKRFNPAEDGLEKKN